MFTEEQIHTVFPTTTIGPWNPALLSHTATVNNKILIYKTDLSGLGNRHLPPHLAIFISNYLNWFSSQREWQLRQHSCHYLSIKFVYRQFLFAIWKATRGQWPTVVLFLSATEIIGEVEQISSLTLSLAFSFTAFFFFGGTRIRTETKCSWCKEKHRALHVATTREQWELKAKNTKQ